MSTMATRSTDPGSPLHSRVDRLEERTALLMVRFDDLRDEVRTLRGEMHGQIESVRHEMQGRFADLGQRIERSEDKLNLRIETVREELDQRIASLEARMDRRFARLERAAGAILLAVLAPWIVQFVGPVVAGWIGIGG